MKIIGLSGKAGSGKDFLYENFLKPLGYFRWALADHFKIWVLGQHPEYLYRDVFVIKPPEIRRLLQLEGTERGRNVYGENIWLDTAYAWLFHLSQSMGIEKFCITDIRFENENDYVRKNGGKVFRIFADNRVDNSSLTAEARQHISETGLNNYDKNPNEHYDGVIQNDYGVADVKQQLYRLIDYTEE